MDSRGIGRRRRRGTAGVRGNMMGVFGPPWVEGEGVGVVRRGMTGVFGRQ